MRVKLDSHLDNVLQALSVQQLLRIAEPTPDEARAYVAVRVDEACEIQAERLATYRSGQDDSDGARRRLLDSKSDHSASADLNAIAGIKIDRANIISRVGSTGLAPTPRIC